LRDGSGTGLGCSEQGKVEATLILDDLSFRSGANLLPALVYIISATGEIEFVNQSFTQFTGWTLADLSDGSFVHLIHPDDLEPTMTALQHALAGTGDYTTKLRFLRADGTFRTFYSHALTRRDDAGAVIGLYGVAFDIDESVRAKAEASTMQRRFETFLATVPQLVWTADATGTIDWYNDRWYEYTGQSREEAFGWGWQSVHHPDDFLEVMRRWPDAVATGEPFDMEFRLRGADGYRWFLTRAFPLRDGDGSVIRWFGSNTDIDDQRRAQQRVTRVPQQLAASDVLPEVAGMSVDGIYLPAEAASLVGGDWHDVFALPDGRLAISIGDVAGHGVEAAATAARLRATIAAFAIEDPDPARVLERANRVSLARGEALATCCVAVVDPKAETIEYATAGHPVPIFAATRQPSECGAFGGVPLGASDAVGATTHRRRVPPGTRIVLYTDGLTEFSRSPVDGERRLLRAVDSLVASPREASAQVASRRSPRRRDGDRRYRRSRARDRARRLRRRNSSVRLALPLERRGDGAAFAARDRMAPRRALERRPRSARRRRTHRRRAAREYGRARPPGLVSIELLRTGRDLVLVVEDSGPGLPAVPPAVGDGLSEGGRGLFLVRALAREVSFGRSEAGGTLVRVVLPLLGTGLPLEAAS